MKKTKQDLFVQVCVYLVLILITVVTLLPLAKPSIATLTIFTFVNTWNDFMGPMIYFNSEANKTIPLGIRMFIGQYSSEYQLIMAASVVALLPILILYVFCQRFFVQGIATSGLKG